jgi:tartrate-resistant acid phosphatase type 5
MNPSRKIYFGLALCALLILACAALAGGAPTSQRGGVGPTTSLPTAALPASPAATLQPTLMAASETPQPIPTTAPTEPPPPTANPTPSALRFAVIGDFGEGNQAELDVSELVKSWQPDLVITVGDNNYPDGAVETIDQRIGQYYQEFIAPYRGAYGNGASENRFFPTLGNHDWNTSGAQPYLDYFELPGNERYYDFVRGPVHFFAVSSDSREPDGVSMASPQAQWLQAGLAASTAPWKVVFFHHAPYSSGYHGSTDWMRWPFKEWGASVVFSGHDHTYERLEVGGLTYIVNGLGGGPIYLFLGQVDGSQVRYNEDYGALLVTADESGLQVQFYNRQGQLVDEIKLAKIDPVNAK